MTGSLETVANEVLVLARSAGAIAAEVTVLEGDEFEVNVRLGEIETLKEAGSRGVGIRVLLGQQAGSASTSDFSQAGLEKMVSSAIALARISTADPFAGLPSPEELGRIEGDLRLYSPGIAELDPARRIEMAKQAEASAMRFDPRISNSEGAGFSSHTGTRVFANSLGFLGCYRTSSCSLSMVPVARDGDRLERDYWYSSARNLAKLESPEHVGQTAAARTLRRLGARKVSTQNVPVIFEPRVARSLLSHIFEALNGERVYRKSSFLAGKLHEQIASDAVTIVNDGTLPGLFGTVPFDAEGVPSRKTTLIANGTLESYLLNTYSAKKLGLRTTGSGSRGLSGNPGIGAANLYLAAGNVGPDEIIASVKNGFLVTELLGSGVNIVNGDYSRGAAGLWIEDGKPAFAVHEVTIAGNLRRMLERIEAVGSDLEFRGAIAAPTVLIREMTVSGY